MVRARTFTQPASFARACALLLVGASAGCGAPPIADDPAVLHAAIASGLIARCSTPSPGAADQKTIEQQVQSVTLGGTTTAGTTSEGGAVSTDPPTTTAPSRPDVPEQLPGPAADAIFGARPAGAVLAGATAIRRVNVYVHVIIPVGGTAPTDSQIDDQLIALNEAYTGQSSIEAAQTVMRFELADTDVTENDDWAVMSRRSAEERAAKKALHQGDRRDLNVYIVDLSAVDTLGWSTFPWQAAGEPRQDGVVIGAGTLPRGARTDFNLGDTLVHEAGHWLGLYHVFQSPGECNPGDYVDDTPAQLDKRYDCTAARSCGSADPILNFMNYTDDVCMDRFTVGQARRVQQMWLRFRR